jgi:alkaline phosphatase D
MAFWQLPADDDRRSRGGLYHVRSFGPPGRRVQVIMLDVRWSRSPWKPTAQRDMPGRERYQPDADPAKTMLGAAQWQWLDAQLRAPADLRLIVSGIQVVADGHGWECWANFPRERQRLYDLIGSTGARGVVLLSGDRHVGAFYRETGSPTRRVPYPLVDFTASGLTHAWKGAAEAGPNRISPLFDEPQFGTLDIDWTARRMTMRLRDVAGRPQRELSLAFDALQPA